MLRSCMAWGVAVAAALPDTSSSCQSVGMPGGAALCCCWGRREIRGGPALLKSALLKSTRSTTLLVMSAPEKSAPTA